MGKSISDLEHGDTVSLIRRQSGATMDGVVKYSKRFGELIVVGVDERGVKCSLRLTTALEWSWELVK